MTTRIGVRVEELGLPRRETRRLTGLTLAAIGDFIRGRATPSGRSLRKLADLLGEPVAVLLADVLLDVWQKHACSQRDGPALLDETHSPLSIVIAVRELGRLSRATGASPEYRARVRDLGGQLVEATRQELSPRATVRLEGLTGTSTRPRRRPRRRH